MMGHTVLDRPTVRAVADEALRRRDDDRLDLLRVSACWSNADARWHVRSTGGQGSHQLLPMASANALALVAEGGGVEAGEEVNVWLLDLDGLTR
jgi:molybdopterin molybdotransferase